MNQSINNINKEYYSTFVLTELNDKFRKNKSIWNQIKGFFIFDDDVSINKLPSTEIQYIYDPLSGAVIHTC